MNVNGSFGKWLGQRRKALDLTQVDLADQVGCSVMTVRKIERDARRPSKQIAERLADVLAIAPEQRAAFIAFARKTSTTPPAPSVSGQLVVYPDLPVQLTQFVGRADELAHIAECLADPSCRLLTVVGPGGIGKTRLALQAAGQQAGRFAQDVVFVPLQAVGAAEFVAAAIAGALKISLNVPDAPNSQIVDYLREKHLLLVMDNFEHLLKADRLLLDLLAACPQVKILVTSRERLNVQGEWVFTLEGLSFPEGQRLDSIERYSAVQLFVQRARQVHTSFSPGENVDAIVHICRVVEGMPLALELAATWLRVMPCRQIAEQIQRDMDFLASPLHHIPERHRSLRAVFEHSWRLLSDDERRVWSQLSVFPGSFDQDAAHGVADASPSVLASLVDKSLIRLEATGRYDLHDLLRQFAAARLAETNQSGKMARRHLGYFLGLANHAEAALFGPNQVAWFDHLEAELDNLQAALVWSLQGGQAEDGLRLAMALGWFWFFRAYFVYGLRWLERLLAASGDAPPSLRAKALQRASDLALMFSDDRRAVTLAEEGLVLGRQIQDPGTIAWSLCCMGIPLAVLHEPDRAELVLEEATTLFRNVQDGWGLHHALVRRGLVATDQGDYECAKAVLEESLALSRRAGDKIAVARSLAHLADVYLEWDAQPTRALVLYEESLPLLEETRDIFRLSVVLWRLANIARMDGKDARARTLAKRSLTVPPAYRFESKWLEFCLAQIGGLDGAAGRTVRAARLLAAGEPSHRRIGSENARDTAQYGRDVASVRASLGDEAFTAAWAEGKAMTLDQAIAYALSEEL